jgi:hypothetical protein
VDADDGQLREHQWLFLAATSNCKPSTPRSCPSDEGWISVLLNDQVITEVWTHPRSFIMGWAEILFEVFSGRISHPLP